MNDKKNKAKTGKVKFCLEYTGLGFIQPEYYHYPQKSASSNNILEN